MFTIKVLKHGGIHEFYEADHVSTGNVGYGSMGVGIKSRNSDARIHLHLTLVDGSLETIYGPGVAYIMNENGSTIAKYELLDPNEKCEGKPIPAALGVPEPVDMGEAKPIQPAEQTAA